MKQTYTPFIALLAVLGCSTAPVKLVDFRDQPVKHLSSQSISMQEIQLDLRMAAEQAGWNVIPAQSPGQMTATRSNGQTLATVEINFNLNKYSVRYKDSTNLDYMNHCSTKNANGSIKIEEKCISPTYNEWVKELNTAISRRLQY